MSRGERAWFGFLVAALIVVAIAVCVRVAARGRFSAAYSSYGSGPEGLRALFLLSAELRGWPARLTEDFAALPREPSLLFAAGDCASGTARPLSRYETTELVRFVERGGVLLVAGARHYLPRELSVRFEPEPNCAPGWRFGARTEDDDELAPEPEPESSSEPARGNPDARERVAFANPEGATLRDLDRVALQRPGRLLVEPNVDAEPILRAAPDESGEARVLGVVVKRGRGRVIVLASGSVFQNRSLAAADGGVLFARLLQAYAPNARVLFDEYHLGVGEQRSLVRYFLGAGVAPFAAQLALFVLIVLWRAGARFGGIREQPAPLPGGTHALVTGLGNLFARTHDVDGALRVLTKQALSRIAAYHHLDPAPASALARALERRGRRPAAAAVLAIAQLEQGAHNDVVGPSRKLDTLVARACEGKSPS